MSRRETLLDALYPRGCVCAVCGEETFTGVDLLCTACRETLRRCPHPAFSEPLDGLSVGLLYDEPLHTPMHRYKYGSELWLADFFAQYMELPSSWHADCLIPVPLHPLKQYLRGYNQCEPLARRISAREGIPVRTDLLRRMRFTRSQTRMPGEQRQKNASGAFQASEGVYGRSVVLVDDVTTTRSTLLACAKALKRAGAARVYAVCACSPSP